jgi:hypothetical protein
VSDNPMPLTRDQIDALRGKGQTYFDDGSFGGVRLMRDTSGYSPLLGGDGRPCSNQVVLSEADLDVIEQHPEGLVVADVTRATGWTVQVAAA